MPRPVARFRPTIVMEAVEGLPSPDRPRRATRGSACFDLAAAETVRLTRRRVTLVRTGLKLRAPVGYFLEVRPRSGLSARGVLMANAPGTIDRDYSGEIRVPLTFLFPGAYTVRTGDRIGQIRLVPDVPARFRVGQVARRSSRTGGFGSTGR